MNRFLLTTIRLVPDVVRGEFINVGIGLRSVRDTTCRVYVSDDLRKTKAKIWFPELDHEWLTYCLHGVQKSLEEVLAYEGLEKVHDEFNLLAERMIWSVFDCTPLEIVQGRGSFDEEFEFWKERMLDLEVQ